MPNAEYIATQLGDPQREGDSWRCRCPVHGGRSLILSDGRDGTLLWNCKNGCSQDEVQDALVQMGLFEKGLPWYKRPPPHVVERDDSEKLEYARKLWSEAGPTKGTRVERYLRARGYTGPLKKSLRYHPDLWHAPSRESWPAMVAKVVDVNGDLIGIHRTFLAHFSPAKAPLGEQAKMALGRVKGGAVRLGRAGEKLLLGEGIETTLCAAQLSGYPGWAVLGSWNFEFVQIPACVRTVIIAADHDERDEAKYKVRDRRRRLLRQGVECHIVTPSEPGTDWADVAVSRGKAGT